MKRQVPEALGPRSLGLQNLISPVPSPVYNRNTEISWFKAINPPRHDKVDR